MKKQVLKLCQELNTLAEQPSQDVQTLERELHLAQELVQLLAAQKQQQQAKASTLEQVHTYLEQHFAEVQSVENVAHHFGLSASYLMHSFKEKYNQTLVQCLQQLRLKRAKQLLITTELGPEEIAARCGFHNMSYFFRSFKAATSCTPQAYRERQQHMLQLQQEGATQGEPFTYGGRPIFKAVVRRLSEE